MRRVFMAGLGALALMTAAPAQAADKVAIVGECTYTGGGAGVCIDGFWRFYDDGTVDTFWGTGTWVLDVASATLDITVEVDLDGDGLIDGERRYEGLVDLASRCAGGSVTGVPGDGDWSGCLL